LPKQRFLSVRNEKSATAFKKVCLVDENMAIWYVVKTSIFWNFFKFDIPNQSFSTAKTPGYYIFIKNNPLGACETVKSLSGL
jgi:hypothetical protein